MHVTQEEGEGRELVDHLPFRRVGDGMPGCVVVQHAGGLPPPDVAGRQPGSVGQRWGGDVDRANVQPAPERRGEEPAGVEDLQQPLQVAGDSDEQWPEERGKVGLPPSQARQQSVDQAVCPSAGQGEEGRNAQVEPNGGYDPGNADQHRYHHVAEVVVGDAETGQPRVLRREARCAQDGVEESDLHPLLATRGLDARHERTYRAPGSEGHSEENLDQKDVPPRQRRRSIRGTQPQRDTEGSHQCQGHQHRARRVRQPPEGQQEPEDPTTDQQAQRPRKCIPAAGKVAEQPQRQGQRG